MLCMPALDLFVTSFTNAQLLEKLFPMQTFLNDFCLLQWDKNQNFKVFKVLLMMWLLLLLLLLLIQRRPNSNTVLYRQYSTGFPRYAKEFLWNSDQQIPKTICFFENSFGKIQARLGSRPKSLGLRQLKFILIMALPDVIITVIVRFVFSLQCI